VGGQRGRWVINLGMQIHMATKGPPENEDFFMAASTKKANDKGLSQETISKGILAPHAMRKWGGRLQPSFI